MSPIILRILAIVQGNIGDTVGQLQSITKALELQPGVASTRQLLASHMRWVKGDMVAAARIHFELWQENREFEHARQLGEIFLDLDDPAAANAWFTAAAQTSPHLRWMLGRSWWRAGGDVPDNQEFAAFKESLAQDGGANYLRLLEALRDDDLTTLSELLHSGAFQRPALEGFPAVALSNMHDEAYVHRRLGNDAKAAALAIKIERLLVNQPTYSTSGATQRRAAVRLLRGDVQGVISALKKMLELGIFAESHRLRLGHIFGELRDEPEFQALLQQVDARMTEQRNILLSDGPLLP